MDVGFDLFIPVANLFYEFLTISVTFFGASIPLYIFILFGILVALFIKAVSIIGGIHV